VSNTTKKTARFKRVMTMISVQVVIENSYLLAGDVCFMSPIFFSASFSGLDLSIITGFK
jgi:hypothetical protein